MATDLCCVSNRAATIAIATDRITLEAIVENVVIHVVASALRGSCVELRVRVDDFGIVLSVTARLVEPRAEMVGTLALPCSCNETTAERSLISAWTLAMLITGTSVRRIHEAGRCQVEIALPCGWEPIRPPSLSK
jgi:hypothetical protein